MLDILREFARRKGIGYSVLIKKWLDDRIREEAKSVLGDNMDRNADELAKLKELFHKAWGQAKESPEYDKKVWSDLDLMLHKLGVLS